MAKIKLKYVNGFSNRDRKCLARALLLSAPWHAIDPPARHTRLRRVHGGLLHGARDDP